MKKLLFLICTFTSLLTFAQNKTDAIYKTDGSIIRGKIVSDENNKVTIETFGGNTLVFTKDLIAEITQEKYAPFHTLKEKGYYNYTSMGALIGSESDAKTTNFSFLMEHNYQFNKYIAIGATTGIEWFNVSVMPLAANVKIMMPATHQMAFYIGGTGGYAVPLEELVMEEYEILETKGGWLASTDFGVIFPSIGNVNLYLAVGYRYQELSYVRSDWWYDEVDRKTKYNRFNLKVGICLH